MNSFSRNLRSLRRAAGFTQKKLAEILNVNFTVVSKWECGLLEPDIDMLLKISDIFGVSIGSLCSGKRVLTEAEKEEKVILSR